MEADGCQVFILRGDTLLLRPDLRRRAVPRRLRGPRRSTSTSSPAPGRPSPRGRRWSSRAPTTPGSATTSGGSTASPARRARSACRWCSRTASSACWTCTTTSRRDYAEHRDFLLRVGQMMAGAFENALLMERLEESNQTLGLLVESGIEFGATLDRDDVLESVARRLCAATSAPNCDIFTLHGDVIRCVACIDHGEPDADYVGTEYPLDQLGLARVALESRQPVVRRGHRRRPARQRVRAPGGPQLGPPGHAVPPAHQPGRGDRRRRHLRRPRRAVRAHRLPPQPRPGRRRRPRQRDALRRARPQRRAHGARRRRELRAVLLARPRTRCSSPPPAASARSRARPCATSTRCATARGWRA